MTYTIESVSEYVNENGDPIIIFHGLNIQGDYVKTTFGEKTVLRTDVEACAGNTIVEKAESYIKAFCQKYDQAFSSPIDSTDYSALVNK